MDITLRYSLEALVSNANTSRPIATATITPLQVRTRYPGVWRPLGVSMQGHQPGSVELITEKEPLLAGKWFKAGGIITTSFKVLSNNHRTSLSAFLASIP